VQAYAVKLQAEIQETADAAGRSTELLWQGLQSTFAKETLI